MCTFLELFPGAELTRAQERDEVVQLAEIVLERRRGEEEDVVALDLLEKLVARGRLVLDLVCLVDDDEVPLVPQDLAAVLRGDRAVVRDDRARVRSHSSGSEIASNSSKNLLSSSPCHWSTSDAGQRMSTRLASPRTLSSLRMMPASIVLPSPTSSARMRAAGHGAAEDAGGDVDLVGQLLDRVGVERDEAVEAGDEGELLRLTTKVEPGLVRGLGREGVRQGGEGGLVDGPEVEVSRAREEGPRSTTFASRAAGRASSCARTAR